MLLNYFPKLKIKYHKIFFDKYTKKIIKKNKFYFRSLISNKEKGIVLIDLFDNSPWICFYSEIVYFLKKNYHLECKFFYFILQRTFFSKFKIHTYRLRSIFKSFKVNEGINENKEEHNIKFKDVKKIFNRINTRKQLINFRYKGIKIGDLIYDTHLRLNFKPTINNLKDHKLLLTFSHAINIYDICEKFFLKNKVKLIITSHPYYIQYGIITRYALHKKIPVVMIYSENNGTRKFRLHKIDNISRNDEVNEYFNFQKNFKKIKNKTIARKIGKKIIEERLSGKTKLVYLKKSPYKSDINFQNLYKKQNYAILFCHDFYDAIHRFRHMIFDDFYKQLNFILNFSKKNKNIKWLIKPHPNQFEANDRVFEDLKQKYKNVIFLDKKTNNKSLIKLKPKFIVTNHGTIAHEFAYYKIPVINTGDNSHISYNFCLHPKNKKQLLHIFQNINLYKKKINFDKKLIYEYAYMYYKLPAMRLEKHKLKLDDRYNDFEKFHFKKPFDFKLNKYLKSFFNEISIR